MTDKEALNKAFSELDYEDEAFNELDKQLQKKVATGVTDGTVDPYRIIADLTEALRRKSEWVGLTDEEVSSLWEMSKIFNQPKHFYLLVEAKLKEKNHGA